MRFAYAGILALVLGVAMARAAHAQAPPFSRSVSGRAPIGMKLGDMLAAQTRARQESVTYIEVRDAVDAGKRPASDLETARQSLKAAQVIVYDQIDALRKSNVVTMDKLRYDAARHVREMEGRVVTEEKALASLDAEARPGAENRLRMTREVLESYRDSATQSARLRALPPRPELPILPPGH